MSTNIEIDVILSRVKEALELTSDIQLAGFFGVNKSTISNWRKRNTIDWSLLFSKCEHISKDWLLDGKGSKEGRPKAEYPVKPIVNYARIEEPRGDLQNNSNIPIIDIEAAAGIGSLNNDHIDVLGYLTLPENGLQRGARYYAIRTRGQSMSPTLFDKDYLIIRYLERSEYSDLRDEYVYVVVDSEGKSYVKRIKDRLHKGFIVCMSDNLDKTNYPNFTLEESEIANLFYVEMKLSPFLPNINSTYYDRLKSLEDRVDEIDSRMLRIEK